MAGTKTAASAQALMTEAQVSIARAGEATCSTAPSALLKISRAALWTRTGSAWNLANLGSADSVSPSMPPHS